MSIRQELIDKLLGDFRSLAEVECLDVPEELRASLSRLLWDLVEEELPDEAFRQRWAALSAPTDVCRPLEKVLHIYLRARRDPFATYFSFGGWGKPAPRFLEYRRSLRGLITRLGKPRRPSAVLLPVPSTAASLPAEPLPIVSDDRNGARND